MTRSIIYSIIFLLLAWAGVSGQGPVPPPAKPGPPPALEPPIPVVEVPDAVVTHTEVDAIAWVFDALIKYPESEWPFMRFVYLPAWADPEWIGCVDVAMNSSVSHSPVLYRGDRHAGGWLLAYNLKKMCPQPHRLEKAIATWDSLAQVDSRFHLSVVNLEEVVAVQEVPVKNAAGQVLLDPRTRQPQVEKKNITQKISKRSSFLAPHLGEALAKHATNPEKSKRIDEMLAKMTASAGIVYPADFLIEQLLTSLVGKYPEFRQYDFNPAVGTPLDNLLKDRGFRFDESQDRFGDRCALILLSDVTGKTRIVCVVYGNASGQPLVGTFDLADNRIRPDQKFIRNLIEFEPQSDASEWFVPMPNRLVEFVLSDKNKKLTRAAPSFIVADDNKPRGHTKDLEMGMSCLLCHGIVPQADGYRTARNDMELFFGSDVDYIGGDFFYTDSSNKKIELTREEAIALVTSRYGDRIDLPDGALGRARRDLIRAYDLLTDYPVEADGPSSVERVALKIKEIYHGYRYRRYDAERLCLELGVKVKPDPTGATGRRMLRQLVPAPPKGGEEDVLIGLIRNGAVVARDDVDAIYTEMARRAVKTRAALAVKK